MIVVPVRVAGQVVGTLNVARMGGEEAHFSQNEFELVQLFAGQASLALENAEAHGAVTVRAEHDALTGLRNHGSFQRELGQAVAAADGGPFALLMLDLDAFKTFNDTCGHPAGDALLAAIGEAMRPRPRSSDLLYRYGGDEFAVILPGATRIDAFEVVERIRRGVANVSSPIAARASRSRPASPATRTTGGPRTSSSTRPTSRSTSRSRRHVPTTPRRPAAIRTCRRSTRRRSR